ncbi:MAG: phosphatidate cytidylyltransferase [Candidatus Portiera sp.]|nr:phosphatidate cytidylyltransferase [Portiera sp.]
MLANLTLIRIISGTLLYVAVVWVILVAHEYFILALLAIAAVLIGWEWFALIIKEPRYKKLLSPLLLLAPLLSYLALEYTAQYFIVKYYMVAISGIWFTWAMVQTANYDRNPRSISRPPHLQALAIINAITLISIFIYFTLILYAYSREIVFAVFTMVCFCDSGGYIFGRWLGGKKLSVNLSPNKTFSGAAGSTFLTLGAYVMLASFFDDLPLSPLAVLLIIPFSIMLQCGDLYQSMLKRHSSIKDSGSLIPGHGGIFDRADGLLWSSFPFYLILTLTETL